MGGIGSGPAKGQGAGGARQGAGRKALPDNVRTERMLLRDAITVSVVFTPALLDKLNAMARREGKSRSMLVREILESVLLK